MNVLLLVLSSVGVNFGASILENPVLGYLEKHGVPLAEEIHRAEKNALQRIVGGVPAADGQYPWQAGLIIDIIGIKGRGVCGASLISSMRLVTAAHCWFDGLRQGWRITVVLGSVMLFSGGTRVQTSAVATHPNWVPWLIRNDIAVIYLPKEVTFSSQNVTELQSLNHVRLKVISNRICQFAFPLILQRSNLCTSGIGGHGTCQGDSGGPLVVSKNEKNILIGVTSFGSGFGCESTLPAAYTRVTSYIDFLTQHLN